MDLVKFHEFLEECHSCKSLFIVYQNLTLLLGLVMSIRDESSIKDNIKFIKYSGLNEFSCFSSLCPSFQLEASRGIMIVLFSVPFLSIRKNWWNLYPNEESNENCLDIQDYEKVIFVHLCVPLCTSVHLCAPLYTFMHLCAPLCAFVHLYTHLWTLVHLFSPLCTCVHLLAPFWHFLAPFGTFWHFLAPFGTFCAQIGQLFEAQ